jgi:8-oxo-dGTP pyrophosphatase MutT (NUDIX family)
MEVDETAAACIEREVAEETGYLVRVKRLVGIYSEPEHTTITYPDGNMVAYVSMLFECTLLGGTATLCDETTAIEWVTPDQLPEPFHDGHRPRVRDAVAGEVAAFFR